MLIIEKQCGSVGWKDEVELGRFEVILTLSNNDCLENFEMNEDANQRDYRWSDPNGFNKFMA